MHLAAVSLTNGSHSTIETMLRTSRGALASSTTRLGWRSESPPKADSSVASSPLRKKTWTTGGTTTSTTKRWEPEAPAPSMTQLSRTAPTRDSKRASSRGTTASGSRSPITLAETTSSSSCRHRAPGCRTRKVYKTSRSI